MQQLTVSIKEERQRFYTQKHFTTLLQIVKPKST